MNNHSILDLQKGFVKVVRNFRRWESKNLESDVDKLFILDLQKELAKVITDFMRKENRCLGIIWKDLWERTNNMKPVYLINIKIDGLLFMEMFNGFMWTMIGRWCFESFVYLKKWLRKELFRYKLKQMLKKNSKSVY